MKFEQYKKAGELLAKITHLRQERDEFIKSVDAEDRYYQGLSTDVSTSILIMATEHYNFKIAKLEKEFEEL